MVPRRVDLRRVQHLAAQQQLHAAVGPAHEARVALAHHAPLRIGGRPAPPDRALVLLPRAPVAALVHVLDQPGLKRGRLKRRGLDAQDVAELGEAEGGGVDDVVHRDLHNHRRPRLRLGAAAPAGRRGGRRVLRAGGGRPGAGGSTVCLPLSRPQESGWWFNSRRQQQRKRCAAGKPRKRTSRPPEPRPRRHRCQRGRASGWQARPAQRPPPLPLPRPAPRRRALGSRPPRRCRCQRGPACPVRPWLLRPCGAASSKLQGRRHSSG